jgi:hypothetical protein
LRHHASRPIAQGEREFSCSRTSDGPAHTLANNPSLALDDIPHKPEIKMKMGGNWSAALRNNKK